MTENIYPSRPIGDLGTRNRYLLPHIKALQNLEEAISTQEGISRFAAHNSASRRVEEKRELLLNLGLSYSQIEEAVDQLRSQKNQTKNPPKTTTRF